MKKDSLEEKPQAQIEATKIVSQEIEELLQMAKVEQDSFRLYIIINRLANMVKEKEEQILVLKKKISESQESSHNQ